MDAACRKPLAWPSVSPQEDWSQPGASLKWVGGVCYPRCKTRVLVPMKTASTAMHHAFRRMCGPPSCLRCDGCTTTVGLIRDTADRAVSMYNMWLSSIQAFEEAQYLTAAERRWLANSTVGPSLVRWRFSRFLDWLASGPWLANSLALNPAARLGWRAGDEPSIRMRRSHFWPQARHFQVGSKGGAARVDVFGRVEEVSGDPRSPRHTLISPPRPVPPPPAYTSPLHHTDG